LTQTAVRRHLSSTVCTPLDVYFLPPDIRPPLRSTLFPYTTLFRSPLISILFITHLPWIIVISSKLNSLSAPFILNIITFTYFMRSEEHTSELQSRFDLVCRLLLEKNK